MLLTDHFVAAVAVDSELGRAEQLTVDDLCAHPHISASRRGFARDPLDDTLEQIGRSRRVAAVVLRVRRLAPRRFLRWCTNFFPCKPHLFEPGKPFVRHLPKLIVYVF